VGKNSLDGLSEEELDSLKKLFVTQKESLSVSEGSPGTDGTSVKLIDEGELRSTKKASTCAVVSSGPSTISVESVKVTSSPSATLVERKTDLWQPESLEPQESIGSQESSAGKKDSESGIPVIEAGYKNAVFVKSVQKDEVAVMDLKNVEWWTIVNPDTLGDDENKDITMEASELGDSFAVIQQDDVSESMANFLAISIERNPDAKQLSPAELKKILDGTLAQAKRQGKLTQAYGWGMWLYSSYSWGSYVVRIYKEPALVKLVLRAACVLYQQPILIPVFARGIWSAASWALIACL